ncbi:MAG: enoyl-CoA hydratase/isomerase family protein [Candidatus Nanopelagicales bacterium]
MTNDTAGYDDLDTLSCHWDEPQVVADDGRAVRVLVARVTNPAHELLDAAVLADLDVLGRRVQTDERVGALVLTGPRPGVFVPHYALGEIAEGSERIGLPTPYPLARATLAAVGAVTRVPGVARLLARTPASGVVELLRTQQALTRLELLPVAVVAAIDGDAQGGGCEVALACDVRVMGRGPYRIGLPELSAGIPPGAGGTQRLGRAVGPARARAMVLQSRTLTPDEALAAGLVDRVVDREAVLDAALDVARRCARRPRAAVGAAKRSLHAATSGGHGARVEAASFMSVATTRGARDRLWEFDRLSTPDGAVTPWRDRSWVD